ncbi:unnamed protein product (macronuclear) [Paramecium tetraurelia]|uniref:Autophagy-related protein n=1 Tax=Paramecium tetraurelia TaxID=5888 RepID=A0CD24_PARTE|nr:uncharacterized protein GSPATT00037476001 [Paramecium tetraurelia]CAK68691.1 unnamed protein product [Paramecium tetraurelia]|eukprot:XP_001436088.1 hypothetical protein (macronuclear) [Paramecium tetraurelia strain d4-2]
MQKQKTQTYKDSHTLEDRKKRVQEQLAKYPEMIPIIVEKIPGCKLPQLQKVKFLVNSSFSFNEFKNTIKKKLNLDEKTSTLFMYCGKNLMNERTSYNQQLDDKLKNIYDQYKDPEDGFLYLHYADAETFGF